MKTLSLLLVSFIALAACGPEKSPMKSIDFKEVEWYAKRSALAYKNESEIREAFPDTLIVDETSKQVQYFIERNSRNTYQVITIRGTDNPRNVLEDAEYIQTQNNKLAIYVHSGFNEDATEVYNAIIPHLDKTLEVRVTGHSLGAAIATLLMMHLHEDGYTLGNSINFGQPKVTNGHGVEKYHFLPLIRIVDEEDVVPLLPFIDLLDSLHGAYEHIGEEVTLLDNQYYAYQNKHMAKASSFGSFWRNLGHESISAHYMKNYLHNIASKLSASQQVPYKQRKQFIKK